MNKTKGNDKNLPPRGSSLGEGQREGWTKRGIPEAETFCFRCQEQRETVKTPVPRCERLCSPPRAKVTPVYLKPLKHSVRPVWATVAEREAGAAEGNPDVRFLCRIKRWLHRFAHRPAMRAGRAIQGPFQQITALFQASQVTSVFRILATYGSLFAGNARR